MTSNDDISHIVTIKNSVPAKKKGKPLGAKTPVAKREEVEHLFRDEEQLLEKARVPARPHTHCSMCKQRLQRLPWNTKCDLLICENSKCSLNHTPQGRIAIERISQADTISDLLSLD